MKIKKAQMQMTENIVIIIVIIFLLVFGFIFYSRVREGSVKSKIKDYSELELVKASQIISNLPELSCSVESLVDVGCMNKLKLEAFVNLELTKEYFEYYRTMFGKSKIRIVSVYQDNTTEFVIYNNSLTGEFSENSLFIPINLHNPVNDTFDFAYVQIIQYNQIIE